MKAWKRVRDLAKEQLTQGVQPERLALGLVLAIAAGTFPLLGFSTLACLALGTALGLNQPLLQAVNYLLSPVQLLLMPTFLRAGEWLFAQPPIPFSPITMLHDFSAAPANFLRVYGRAGLLAVAAWGLCVLILSPALYLALRASLRTALRVKEG